MKGVIAAGDQRSAEAGAMMFSRGGNAIDAAVAAAFTSFVVEILAVNIGGSGFGMIAAPDQNGVTRCTSYDFFSSTPSGKPRTDMDFRQILIDFGKEKQPFYIGRASTAVPGAVAGLARMAADRGSLPLSTLLEPAIHHAENGFAVGPFMHMALRLLAPIFQDTEPLRALFHRNGQALEEGDWVRLPQLAQALRELASSGPESFYKGRLAEAILNDHEAHGGLLTRKDLADYRVHELQPLRAAYRGWEVLLTPPPSFGGVWLALAFRLLETQDIRRHAHGSAAQLRILSALFQVTNAGILDWFEINKPTADKLRTFFDPARIRRLQRDLNKILATGDSCEPPPLPSNAGNTSHIAALDESGHAVSLTTSAGEAAGYLVEGTGLLMNNMMGEIDLHPKGFHQDPPGTRLSSMMCPTIVLEKDRPILTLGSAGSNRICTAILQAVINRLDYGMPLDACTRLPRIHRQGLLIQAEGGTDPLAVELLRRSGHNVNAWDKLSLYFGGVQAAAAQGGQLEAAGDPRRHGAAIRWH